MTKPLLILLVIAFYGCSGENANNSINSTEETYIDTTKCGELVLEEEMNKIITLTSIRPDFELTALDKNIGTLVIGLLGDSGFFRKIAKDTLSVLIFSSKGNLQSMKMRECKIQNRLLNKRLVKNGAIYVLYYSENLKTDDSISKYQPIRAVKLKLND